jgi:hypothetical protein
VPPYLYSTGNRSYSLTVGGVNVIMSVPLDEAPIRWTESGPGVTGSLSFLVRGTLGSTLQDGAIVRLKDNVTNRTLFGGLVLRRTLRPGPGSLRWTEVECASHDWWLDHKLVPRYENKRDAGSRHRKKTSDRDIVKELVERRGGRLEARNAHVDETNSDMDNFQIEGETLRGALELIADEAQDAGSPGTRLFYVDADWDLHWFNAAEGLTAPYRIGDGSYIRTVLDTSGLVEYWSLREVGGTTNYGARSVANLTQSGTVTQGVTDIGVVNEPAYRAVTLGTTGVTQVNPAPASLFPGDTFSLEFWFRVTSGTGTNRTILVSFGSTDNAYHVRMTSADKLELLLRTGSAQNFISTPTYTDDDWHHVVFAHNPGDTDLFVDGASVAGTHTNRVFGTAADTLSVGLSGSSFLGSLAHVAVYSTKLSAATALAHYEQGITLVPEDMEVQYDSSEDAHFAYVVSEVKGGSGWVRPDNASSWPLGSAHIYVEGRKVKTDAQRNRRGKAALRRARKVIGGSFTVTSWHGWRAGQLLTIDESALGLSSTHQIQSVNGELAAGNAATYRIEFGAPRKSLVRKVKRRKRPRDD